ICMANKVSWSYAMLDDFINKRFRNEWTHSVFRLLIDKGGGSLLRNAFLKNRHFFREREYDELYNEGIICSYEYSERTRCDGVLCHIGGCSRFNWHIFIYV